MFHRPKTEDQTTENKEQEKQMADGENWIAGSETSSDMQGEMDVTNNVSSSAVNNPSEFYKQAKEESPQMSNQDTTMPNTTKPDMNEVPAGIFQRTPAQPVYTQTPVQGNQGFSGVAQTPTTDTWNGEERRLVIGQGITMSGEIEACDVLQVEGTLEAALKGARVIDIAESGTFYGTVEIEEATIAGRFEGEITVNGRLTIKSGGSVTGSISYKELAVEAGAMIDGKISPLAMSGQQAQQKPQAKNDNKGKGSELPFGGSVAAAAE